MKFPKALKRYQFGGPTGIMFKSKCVIISILFFAGCMIKKSQNNIESSRRDAGIYNNVEPDYDNDTEELFMLMFEDY